MRIRLISVGVCAVLIATAGTTGGCLNNNRAAGCKPVADEAQLLDEYASEPVFDIRPAGVRDVFGPQRSKACVVDPDWPNDPTETAVDLNMSVSREYGATSLAEIYEAEVTRRGWRPVRFASSPAPSSGPTASGQPAGLRYCKQVRGTTSYLSINAMNITPEARAVGPGGATMSPARGVSLPGPISVRISAAPEEPSCPST